MATITSTQISSTPRGSGELHVTFQFILDNGDVILDGPRFYLDKTDLDTAAADVGQRLLDTLATQEVEEWLSN